jgi:hypothetical protein
MTLGMKYKSMPLSPEGEIPVSISSLTQPQREQLANVSRTLFISRMAMIITPIPVKGDVNKILARMERQLETYYDAVGTDSDGRPMGEFDTAPRRQSVLSVIRLQPRSLFDCGACIVLCPSLLDVCIF